MAQRIKGDNEGTFAVRVKEPGMKIGVLLSADGTLVNRWVHAAGFSRENADKVAAQIRAEGDEATVVRHRFQGIHPGARPTEGNGK